MKSKMMSYVFQIYHLVSETRVCASPPAHM